MELLKESKLADGRSLRIYRQITPDTNPVPERLIRYVISIGEAVAFPNNGTMWKEGLLQP